LTLDKCLGICHHTSRRFKTMPVTVRKSKASPKGQLPTIREVFDLSQEALAQTLGVSSRTVARWEGGVASPRPLALTRLRLLMEVHEKARKLFKGRESDVWFRTPNPALRGQPPLERLRATGGLEEVSDLLGRIEWGIPT
jgi:putative toxin-antitoxin system antitoxin component (TIGR02293 family)